MANVNCSTWLGYKEIDGHARPNRYYVSSKDQYHFDKWDCVAQEAILEEIKVNSVNRV